MGNYEMYLETKANYKKLYSTKTTHELEVIEMQIEFSWPHSNNETIALEALREELKSRG